MRSYVPSGPPRQGKGLQTSEFIPWRIVFGR